VSDEPPTQVPLRRRTLPEQLRHLAQQLLAGTDPRIIATNLEIIADAHCPPEHAHLLGKRVRVTLAKDLAQGAEGPVTYASVIAEGVLLGFGDDGEFELDQGDSGVHHCWPMLGIKETEE
jgi:hypothetical protein